MNLNKQMNNMDLIERNKLLQNKEKNNSKKTIPPVSAYNRALPSIPEVMKKKKRKRKDTFCQSIKSTLISAMCLLKHQQQH